MNKPMQQRKRRVPTRLPKATNTPAPLKPMPRPPLKQTASEVQEAVPTPTLLPHEQRRAALHAKYPAFPAGHIFVDAINGVELFKNPQTGGWCARPETVLPYYKEGIE